MKIAILSFYSGNLYRGVETYVHELSNCLVNLGEQVVVYQNGQKHKNSKYTTVSIGLPIDWSRLGGGWTPWDYWKLLVKNFTKISLQKIDPDTEIIIPTNGMWQSLYSRLWAWRNKKKMVISGQSGPGLDDRINLWTFPDMFVGMTDYQCQWAKKANPFVKIVKIPNGVDLDKFTPATEPIKLNLKKPIILNVGVVTPFKRQDLLLDAAKKIKASVLLVGKGGTMDFVHSDMPKVYTACDLFSYPTSPQESFGIAMLEAMASGLAVVATDDPIRREIVGEAGLFVDPTNATAYAQALKKALHISWGDKPRRQAEKFSWDKIAKLYDLCFHNC
ncbi:MAG: glycosyltransferase family 4 protein [Patescibacteria group bacterium]